MVMDATFSVVLNNVLMLRRHDNRLLWLPNVNNKYSPNTIVFNKKMGPFCKHTNLLESHILLTNYEPQLSSVSLDSVCVVLQSALVCAGARS